ncbi:hypothetical protein [Paenibacillus harenae]|uniref:Uncharacterized protein n=1 Tax=Paenibacillus harenae TaxID=306543 RepID=A0ABT9TW71_PAEHA|nr:hypothetical protein [Paenibacillus harenae]MDQ0057995.1 hypothetical protein [Paenibacillus harenae]MDQ0111342.1 hypothetical protein [Paenibacillus harenae]
MIKYGLDRVTELRFRAIKPSIERRDHQWMDITLRFELEADTPVPDDLIDFTALVICTHSGAIAQIVPQDEGCDCEYQFTVGEKEQITNFVMLPHIQEQIHKLSSLS